MPHIQGRVVALYLALGCIGSFALGHEMAGSLALQAIYTAAAQDQSRSPLIAAHLGSGLGVAVGVPSGSPSRKTHTAGGTHPHGHSASAKGGQGGQGAAPGTASGQPGSTGDGASGGAGPAGGSGGAGPAGGSDGPSGSSDGTSTVPPVADPRGATAPGASSSTLAPSSPPPSGSEADTAGDPGSIAAPADPEVCLPLVSAPSAASVTIDRCPVVSSAAPAAVGHTLPGDAQVGQNTD